MNKTVVVVMLAAAIGCGGSPQLVREPKPVLVSAEPPKPEKPAPAPPAPEPPPRVVVRVDRIQVNEAIYFESSRSRIRGESHDLLNEIARVINEHPELVKIRIEGHTDSIGSSKTNLELSKRRAAAVREYLVEQGVDARRLIAEGFGDDNPIADNETSEGRARNRRVAFTVLDRSGQGGDS